MTDDGTDNRPTCFIAMPLTTHPDESETYGDSEHWYHVLDSLFVRAVESAGFRAIKPVAVGSHLIHGSIIKHLIEADLVLCDLSGHNPNVFFELGVRTSLNLPIALVRDEHTSLPFDTSGINTHEYSSALRGWEMDAQLEALTTHVTESAASCNGTNPLWKHFGLIITAQEPAQNSTPLEAKVDLLVGHITDLQQQLEIRERESALGATLSSWADHQMSRADPNTTPAQLFIGAVKRLDGARYLLSATVTSPTTGELFFSQKPSPKDIARLDELAARYEVNFFRGVMPAGDETE